MDPTNSRQQAIEAGRGPIHTKGQHSEWVERSKASGDQSKESNCINLSLLDLGDVIFALAQKNKHVPYRRSKLTEILQSSIERNRNPSLKPG
ncbi:hypothetical protein FCM35_KLT02058 [Carex littledalei]|uniref:Kinesin motor domain-containing protein n=1 Tax=Carex littledalei TaxID=544730 RepID=A0A833RA44_9POAL|nr:hypothetical protein FCM35_KLT02058 [Carex littledalei]